MERRGAVLGDYTGRLGQAGEAVGWNGREILAIVADEVVTAAERARLRAIGATLVARGDELQDVEIDIMFARQILHIGRHRSPDKHLRARFADLEAQRATRCRQRRSPGTSPRDTASQPTATARG